MPRWTMAGLAILVLCTIGAVTARSVLNAPDVRTVLAGEDPGGAVVDERTGRVYVGTRDGIDVLDGRTGATVQAIHTGDDSDVAAVDGRAGRIFAASCCVNGGDALDILDMRHGRLLRRMAIKTGGAPLPLVVDEQTGRTFLLETEDDSRVQVDVVDTRSGRLLRHVPVGYFATALAFDDSAGRIALFSFDAFTWVATFLDARSGAVVHTTPLGFTPGSRGGSIAVDARHSRAFVVTPDNINVTMLDTRSGALLRTINIGAGTIVLATDARSERVFAVDRDMGMVTTLDSQSGAIVRKVRVGQAPIAPVVDERSGRVFVFNAGDGSVSVLDARSGAIVRTAHIGSDTLGMPVVSELGMDEQHGRVYVASAGPTNSVGNPLGNGSVSILDARSGTVVRAITVGVFPGDVVADERTGRAFVVNQGGSTPDPDPWSWLPGRLRRLVPALSGTPSTACTGYATRGSPPARCHDAPSSVSVVDPSH